jgi:hypothetical protein
MQRQTDFLPSTGTNEVMLNAKPADITVESSTYSAAAVPSGATTAKITVPTAVGTLNSILQFLVTK